MQLSAAAQQAWPAFVLVAGLLLVGVAAHVDGLFEWAGSGLERLPGSPVALLAGSLLLVAAVTAILNLDTAVVFLSPVLVHAARRRGVGEEPFLYGSLYMANASSLFLPGSNLTNLIVLANEALPGGGFASRIILVATTSALATGAGVLLLFRRHLGRPRPLPAGAERVSAPSGITLAAVVAAGALTVGLSRPAVPVLLVGALAVTVSMTRRRLDLARVREAVGPTVLVALFSLSVALGVLARSWDGPARALGAGRWGTAGVGALSAALVNNLPASVLLSARPVDHPRALLLGLNVGPNLVATGSLSAYLWFRASREAGARPSLSALSRRGVVLAPVAILLSLLVMTVTAAPR